MNIHETIEIAKEGGGEKIHYQDKLYNSHT